MALTLNNRPRKKLAWKTPAEALNECLEFAFNPVLRRPVESAQCTSLAFAERCRKMGVRPSMGTMGDAYDNAMAESFLASLKAELIERHSIESNAQARMAVFTWIEGWYNARRRHSGLGYLSSLNF